MYGPLDPRGLRGPAESSGLVGRFHSQTHQAVIDLFPWSPHPLQEASPCLGPLVSPGHRQVHPRYSHDSPEIETGLRGRVGGGVLALWPRGLSQNSARSPPLTT